jgi:DNA-binding NarL/FixJ family response regulator
MTMNILHVQHEPLHKSTIQNLKQLQQKLNFRIQSVPDLKQLVSLITQQPPHTHIWLDAELFDINHMHEQLHQLCTTLQVLTDMLDGDHVKMHVIIPNHASADQLHKCMKHTSCGWIMRSDLSLIHICTQIMQDVVCGMPHVSASVHKILQHQPVLTARDKTRISWFTPAHNRIIRDTWIKQAYAATHISYNTFETWESFIRSIVMSSFTAHVIVLDDHMLLNNPHMHAYDVVNCVHTLRSHAAPHTHVSIYVSVSPSTPTEKIREWLNTPHVSGITCAFDASYTYEQFETSLHHMINQVPHVCASVAARLDAGKQTRNNKKGTPLRQKQIWELIVKQGASNKQIAHRLNITEASVKQHISRMLKKYALRNRTQLSQITIS